MTLKDIIEKEREVSINEKFLVENLGVDVRTFYNWKNSKATPGPSNRKRLVIVFDDLYKIDIVFNPYTKEFQEGKFFVVDNSMRYIKRIKKVGSLQNDSGLSKEKLSTRRVLIKEIVEKIYKKVKIS